MIVFGADYVRELAIGSRATAKMVFNSNGAIIFPATEQHQDQKAAGISYEDNYKGNALAAMLSNHQLEIRFHESFSDAQVRGLVRSLVQTPELSVFRDWRVTYQGRELTE